VILKHKINQRVDVIGYEEPCGIPHKCFLVADLEGDD
jgi:hypothetical protein